jgi:hypothetical protein
MNADELIKEWRKRARRIQSAHYDSAAWLDRWQYGIGLPLVALSTFVGTTVFANLQKEADFWVSIGVGLASVLAAVLAGIQTFLRLPERSAKHQVAGVHYGALKREIEQHMAFPGAEGTGEAFVENLRQRWDKLNEESPVIPKGIWKKWEKRDTSEEGKKQGKHEAQP